jgi:hypothetical protein
MFSRRIPVFWFLLLLPAAGCRRYDPPFDEAEPPPSGTFTERLSFSWTGIPQSARFYSRLHAAYDPVTGTTIIETQGDSLSAGCLQLAVRGHETGTYRYSITGGPSDTNQVFLRFVPQYEGGVPVATFLLTGNPADSLEAEVVIRTYGTLNDTIAGTFAATLATSQGDIRILIYNGVFLARRTE